MTLNPGGVRRKEVVVNCVLLCSEPQRSGTNFRVKCQSKEMVDLLINLLKGKTSIWLLHTQTQ